MNLENERKGVEKKFYDLCKSVVEKENLDLYDMEFVKSSNTLRIYIIDEKTGTAVIDDCVRIDKAMGPVIEEEEWIPESIVLEVSSPGLYRKLKTLKHFETSVGNDIDLTLNKDVKDLIEEPVKGLKGKKIKVNLKEVKDNGLNIFFGEKKFFLSFENIKKASLSPDIKF